MTEQSPLPTAWPKAHESLGVLFNDEIAISAGLGLISHPLRFFSAEGNGARAGIGFQLLPGSARDLWMGSYQSLCSSQVGLAGIAHDGATEVLFQRLAWDIAADKSWHRLYIGPFPDWDDATQNFADLLRAQGHDCEAQDRIWYDVTGVTDREDYLSQLSSNARKNIRKQLNRMTKSEDYGYRYYTRDEALEGLRRFVEIDAHSWKASDGEPVGSTPAVLRFYETMVQKFAEQDNVLITVISLGGRDLAATIGFMHNGIGYTIKSSFSADPAYKSYSLGTMSIFLTVCGLIDTGRLHRITLLSNKDYAQRLSTTETQVTMLCLYRRSLRMRGFLALRRLVGSLRGG